MAAYPGLPPASKRLWFLVLLLLMLLGVRLGSLWYVQEHHPQNLAESDTASYENPARALLQLGRLAHAPDQPERPEVVRTPGYPVFLAGLMRLGLDRVGIAVVQVCISLIPVVVAWRLAGSVAGGGAAVLAALLACLDLAAFLYPQKILSESLFAVLYALCAWMACRALYPGKVLIKRCFLAGLLLGLATLVRPVGYYFLPVMIGILVWTAAWRDSLFRAVVVLVATALPWVLLVGGWQLRNQELTGSSRLSHIVGINLLDYRAASALATAEGLTLDEARTSLHAMLPPMDGPEWTDARRYAEYEKLASETLAQYPGELLRGQLVGLTKILLVPAIYDIYHFLGHPVPDQGPLGDLTRLEWPQFRQKWLVENPTQLWLFLAAVAYLMVVYAGCVLALGRLVLRRGPWMGVQIMLWCMAGYILVISAGPTTYERLRYPAMALLCILSALGWSWLWGRRDGV